MSTNNIPAKIEKMIYTLRGQKVMMDSDLADLYGIETKALTRQVRRNIERFPEDFLITPNSGELEDLRRQFGTANPATDWNYMRRTVPMLFTENGVAMLSSVLKSPQAIQVNISIMRIFTRLRSFLMLEKELVGEISRLKEDTNMLFKVVFERLDNLEEKLPSHDPKRKKIGLKS